MLVPVELCMWPVIYLYHSKVSFGLHIDAQPPTKLVLRNFMDQHVGCLCISLVHLAHRSVISEYPQKPKSPWKNITNIFHNSLSSTSTTMNWSKFYVSIHNTCWLSNGRKIGRSILWLLSPHVVIETDSVSWLFIIENVKTFQQKSNAFAIS